MIFVEFRKFNIEAFKDEEVGVMSYDEKSNSLKWEWVEDDTIEQVIDVPIVVDDKKLSPKDNPKEFIKNLCYSYRTPYFRALLPETRESL